MIIDRTPSKDHLGMITQFLRFENQIVRIHGDAVASYKARRKPDKVPLGDSSINNRPS